MEYKENNNEKVSITGIRKIGNYAFYQCSKFIPISFDANLITIGDYAFTDADSLETLLLPQTITSYNIKQINKNTFFK